MDESAYSTLTESEKRKLRKQAIHYVSKDNHLYYVGAKGETRRVVRETEKHTGSFVLAIPTVLVNISRGFVAIVTLKTIQECCRVCNKSYFFLCLNLRQLV
jgi:hypothetical protein